MAKNFRRILATTLVMCMLVSALPMQALAAEDDGITATETITGGDITITFTPTENEGESSVSVSGSNESGATVNLTGGSETSSNSVTDSNGTVTESVTTEVTLSGTETTADGTVKDVTYQDKTTDTTITGADGTVTEKTVNDGSETKTWTEKDSGNEAGQPKVELELKPGETTTGTATSTEVTGDKQKGEDDKQYNYTETTTTDRTVTGTASDITVTESGIQDAEMNPLDVVEKTDAEDLIWKDYIPDPANKKAVDKNNAKPIGIYDEVVIDGETRWMPRVERREDQMIPELMDLYTPKTAEDGTTVYVPNAKSGNTIYSTNKGEFFLFGDGELSDSNYFIFVEDGSALCGGAGTIRVCDEFGNIVGYTYCMDMYTGTDSGKSYIVENLDDADYFMGTEEEQQAIKDQLRAIAQKGYWGTEEGMGSLDQIKADLKAFIESNPDFTFTYTVPDVLVKLDNETPVNETFSAADNMEYLLELVEMLNEAGALTVTQSAIWAFNRYDDASTNIEFVYERYGDEKLNQAMAMFREYLLSEEIQESAPLEETIIYDQDSFLVEDSLKLSVGDKIEGSLLNEDEDDTNDEYNVDLSFKLVVAPGEDDDLIVCLVDSNNTVVRKARIAGEAAEGEVSDEIIIGEDGSYTFVNVPLQENSNIGFNLTLEGVQHMEKGVYIYKSVKKDGTPSYDYAQTLIGVGEGSHDVDVSAAFTVNFSVDENNYVVAKTVWHDEYDPSNPPSNPPEDPGNPPEDPGEEVPPQIFRLNNQNGLETIPEEPVPLAAPVITGDGSALWMAVVLLAMFGMVAINLNTKKQKTF